MAVAVSWGRVRRGDLGEYDANFHSPRVCPCGRSSFRRCRRCRRADARAALSGRRRARLGEVCAVPPRRRVSLLEGPRRGKTCDRAGTLHRQATAVVRRATLRYGVACTAEPASGFDQYLAQCSDDVAAASVMGGSLPACGDGSIDVPGEQCDVSDVGGGSCASLGFAGGALACDGSCAFDTASCQGAASLAAMHQDVSPLTDPVVVSTTPSTAGSTDRARSRQTARTCRRASRGGERSGGSTARRRGARRIRSSGLRSGACGARGRRFSA